MHTTKFLCALYLLAGALAKSEGSDCAAEKDASALLQSSVATSARSQLLSTAFTSDPQCQQSDFTCTAVGSGINGAMADASGKCKAGVIGGTCDEIKENGGLASDSTASTAGGDEGAPTAGGDDGGLPEEVNQQDEGAPTAGGDEGAATAGGDEGAPTAGGDEGAPTAGGDEGAPTAGGDDGGDQGGDYGQDGADEAFSDEDPMADMGGDSVVMDDSMGEGDGDGTSPDAPPMLLESTGNSTQLCVHPSVCHLGSWCCPCHLNFTQACGSAASYILKVKCVIGKMCEDDRIDEAWKRGIHTDDDGNCFPRCTAAQRQASPGCQLTSASQCPGSSSLLQPAATQEYNPVALDESISGKRHC